ncbi:MAG: hypothetical protein M1814_000938 [Vezdaea aestivalis]|nr:MAG: hypothetical protein M1814_000938 [Vezdaea aestivalis]
MSDHRSNSGVRNLRAMFESGPDASASDSPRGRSPGDTDPSGANGSVTPRHLSKVRANFVAVEKGGQIGLQKTTGTEGTGAELKPPAATGLGKAQNGDLLGKSITNPAAQQAKSGSVGTPSLKVEQDNAGTIRAFTSKEDLGDGWNPAELPITPATRALSTERTTKSTNGVTPTQHSTHKGSQTSQAKPHNTAIASPLTTKKPSVSPSLSKSAPKEVVSKRSTVGMRGESSQEKPAPAKVGNDRGIIPTRPTPAAIKISKLAETSKSQRSTTSKSSSPRTPSRPTASEPARNSPRKTPAKTNGVVSKPVEKARLSKKPTNATEAKTNNPIGVAPVPVTAPSLASRASKRSPTRTVRLPASATASTASFAAKVGLDNLSSPPNLPRTGASAPKTLISRKSSRHSLPNKNRTEGERPRSRVSSGSIPSRAPDESFLARMMRPTTSSLSKTHEKIEIKHPPPPRRAPTMRKTRKSNESQASRHSEELTTEQHGEVDVSTAETMDDQSLAPVEEVAVADIPA